MRKPEDRWASLLPKRSRRVLSRWQPPEHAAALDGCWAKVSRAHELTELLDAECALFIRKQGPRVELVRGGPGPDRVIVTELPPVPLRLSVLTGEVLHNLRSCLDHLVHQLIVAHTRREPRFRTYEFPVSLSRDQFHEAQSRKLRDISPDAVLRIAQVQPFNFERPRNTSLHVLHELNLVDKHRLLLIGVVNGHLRAVMASNDDTDVVWGGGGFQGPLETGTVLAEFDHVVTDDMAWSPFVSFSVALQGQGAHVGGIPLSRLLGMLGRFVERVLLHLDPALRTSE